MIKLTYKKSGVDIHKAGAFKRSIKPLVRRSFSPQVLKDIGGFGSLFRFNRYRFNDPVLVSSTDGVGTKLKIAQLVNKHDTIGIDAVAMNVNDILCTGARPLFFLDYIACGRINPRVLFGVVKGIAAGCIESGCSLIGGETAEMPAMYGVSEYDIAGFCVGVVEKSAIIDGSRIRPGDALIGLASSGLHSNGYSLVRRVFSEKELKRYSAELLKPTRIYVKPVLRLLERFPRAVTGIAHITGGAFYDKLKRILPGNVAAVIDRDAWSPPEVFRLIQEKGNVPEDEMYRTFNMGVGLVVVVKRSACSKIEKFLAGQRMRYWIIGEIIKGSKEVRFLRGKHNKA